MVWKKEIEYKGQLLTLSVVVLSIVVYCSPHLSSLFVYHRQAIIDGEIWRIFTAPLVHFSASHIFWDILVFGVAGIAVNISGFPRFWLVCFLTAIMPGLIFPEGFPDLEYYGGLSGLATGAVAYYCLCTVFLTERKRQIWVLILLVVGIKIIIEIALNTLVFVKTGATNFRVLPSVHIVGFFSAIVTIAWACLQKPKATPKNLLAQYL